MTAGAPCSLSWVIAPSRVHPRQRIATRVDQIAIIVASISSRRLEVSGKVCGELTRCQQQIITTQILPTVWHDPVRLLVDDNVIADFVRPDGIEEISAPIGCPYKC